MAITTQSHYLVKSALFAAMPPDSTVTVYSHVSEELSRLFLTDTFSLSHPPLSSFEWPVKTKYYTATLTVSLVSHPNVPDFSSPALVILIPSSWENIKKQLKNLLSSLSPADISILTCLSEQHESLDEDKLDEWDMLCIESGFEFISLNLDEKEGIDRVQEALTAHPWPDSSTRATGSGNSASKQKGPLSFDDDFTPFVSSDDIPREDDLSPTESEIETFRQQIFGSSQNTQQQDDTNLDNDISDFASRLLSLKEQSENLPDDQRRQFAAKVALAFASHFGEDETL